MTVAEVARRSGLYRSNLSAMDAGRRAVSLRLLERLGRLLACSPGELLEGNWTPQRPLFRRPALERALEARDRGLTDGLERGWVHTTLLAWQRHYGRRA
jgi:DNA-binding Xre family transcriptional regulator